ncbi:hypothetical protein ACFPH8_06145 [Bizionia hallyeonensis]|uniref:Uncharacterized protein n=1 Tax=Bizionia hallyeonensis TaxID=1123757 RepID=A0ABW0C434_9FLAO
MILKPVSNSRAGNIRYFGFYMDRAITFKYDCIKISSRTDDVYANVITNIHFEKGWNFIEENLIRIKTNRPGDSLATQLNEI